MPEQSASVADTPLEKAVPPPAASGDKTVSESLLRATGDSILDALKQRNGAQLSRWIHPQWKLHFSPYGYLDTQEGQTLSGTAIQNLFRGNQILYWGSFDGSGDSINLAVRDYLKEFVPDRDFKNAPAVSVDRVTGRGNTLLNTLGIDLPARVVEYYFPGHESQGFMDWKTLRLVFQVQAGRLWPVCIAHDEWTI